MTETNKLIRDILSRTNDVRDWPEDEQVLYRTGKGDFETKFAAVTELRLQKILAIRATGAVDPATPATKLIADERMRQISAEGFSADHDRGHSTELMLAAEAYLNIALYGIDAWHNPDGSPSPPGGWPWASELWKPTGDRVRDLVKAAALIAAAIDAETAPAPPVDQAQSTQHDFSQGERCSFCDVNQWEIDVPENCTPHPFISFTTETPVHPTPKERL
jgi:hypothetical protein